MKGLPRRVPKHPHREDDRLVPIASCGCTTCQRIRVEREGDEEAAHWERIGKMLGLDEDEKAGRI